MALIQNGSARDGNIARLVAFSVAAAGISGAMGVGFGAFAAHGLASLGDPTIVEWVKTGASYQLWHAAALLGLTCLAGRLGATFLRIVAWCFFLGGLLFGGSLYILALLHWSWVVFVTPVGGMLMLIGWVMLLFGGWRYAGRSAS